jgi:methionyl-tRNA formyltransferase
VIVVVAFGQIIPKAILDMPHNCCVNVHASLLPRYRGAAPIQWTIINGDETAGVTTQRMDEGLDTGDIIMTEEVKLSGEETAGSLFDILSEIGARLCVRTLSAIADGTATYTPQDKSHASHTSKITKEMGDIDWSFTAVEIERRIRGCSPWPGTYTHIGDKTLKIWRARVADDDTAGAILQSMTAEPGGTAKHMAREDVTGAHEIPCGTVVSSQKGVIAVACGEGVLLLDELQLQGKKRMDASSFLNGYKIEPGTRLIRLAE